MSDPTPPKGLQERDEGRRNGFRPWASIEAGDLKAEYDRAVEELHASKMRAFLLSVRLDAAEQVCELADVYMGSAPTPQTRRPLGKALTAWRKMTYG